MSGTGNSWRRAAAPRLTQRSARKNFVIAAVVAVAALAFMIVRLSSSRIADFKPKGIFKCVDCGAEFVPDWEVEAKKVKPEQLRLLMEDGPLACPECAQAAARPAVECPHCARAFLPEAIERVGHCPHCRKKLSP